MMTRKAATDCGVSKEASADQTEGPAWGELGYDRYRAQRATWREVLSAALAFALLAGTMLLVAIYQVGE